MSNYTHQTAPTQFVEADGIRFAYYDQAERLIQKLLAENDTSPVNN